MRYDVILVDGSHLLHRSVSSYGELGIHVAGEWIFTGGVYGFLRITLAAWKKYAHDETKLIVCWEGGNTYRTGIDPEYKANRRATTEEARTSRSKLRGQEVAIRELIAIAGWEQAIAPGYEADDALASLAKKFEAEGKSVAIYSGDQDMHQCVSDTVHVISGSKGDDTVWTPAAVEEKWGLPPNRVVEAKALIGDAGDNIPGIEGLGHSWAAKILADASLDKVHRRAEIGLSGYHNGKLWKNPKLSKKILSGWDQIKRAYVLAKVVSDCQLETSKKEGSREILKKILTAYQMNSMTSDAGLDAILAIGT